MILTIISVILVTSNKNKGVFKMTEQDRLEFEIWWTATYAGKLGQNALELGFKEVALAAWLASIARNQ